MSLDNICPTVVGGEYRITQTPGHELYIVYTFYLISTNIGNWKFPSTKEFKFINQLLIELNQGETNLEI